MKPTQHSFWPAALALLLILAGCQKDLLQDDAPVLDSFPLKTGTFDGHERSYVTFEELNSHLQGHEVYDRYAEKFENTDPGAYISGISRNRILKLENDSITTYTLDVITPDPGDIHFTNLVFVEKDGVLRRYFLRYTPGENWKNALLEGDVPSGYEGGISFVDDSGHAFSSIADYPATTESSWSDGCFSVIYSENTPCCGSFSCCPCTDRNGIDTLVIEIICPGGGGGSGGSGGDPEDPVNDPWAGGAVIGSGGGPGGSGGLGNIGISTEPYFDYMLVYNLNALLQSPLTLEQENWIMANEENYQFALAVLAAVVDGEVDAEFAQYAISLMMVNPDANPLLRADCQSFEYAQPPGALQKGCSVQNFNHTFYTFGVNSNGSPYYGEVDSNIPIIYFTMPNWMTNGQAANVTAEAVTAAVWDTDLYFYENPYATEFDVGNFFKDTLIAEITALGGTVSTTVEPFPIPNPAPYVTRLIGLGNPYNCD